MHEKWLYCCFYPFGTIMLLLDLNQCHKKKKKKISLDLEFFCSEQFVTSLCHILISLSPYSTCRISKSILFPGSTIELSFSVIQSIWAYWIPFYVSASTIKFKISIFENWIWFLMIVVSYFWAEELLKCH